MRHKNKTIVTIFFLMALVLLPFTSADAQNSTQDYVEFTTEVNPVVKKVIRKALSEKIDWFYEEYKYIPYLHYALVDLNGDNKNEIIVRFGEEYEFRDRFDNMDTHVFAQTSKGLLEILETRARHIELGRRDANGLRIIYAHQAHRPNRPLVYEWDGKREYVERD